ncbi:MAG: hypothetical protein J7K48_02745 [Thermococcus sp.]|nr:hypothetical protein [Thermococcus sp.]
MAVLRDIVEEALFEARPYVEYYDRLRGEVFSLLRDVNSLEELISKVEAAVLEAEEPFKTDLRIFLQKLESLHEGHP